MALVDGPTEESDNLICVAYRHQFDVVNESTGEAFRLHHVEANKVSQPVRTVANKRKQEMVSFNFRYCHVLLKLASSSQEWRLRPSVLELMKLRKENCEVKVNLGYIVL